jgi:FkbM family methyltransferase
MNSFIQLIKEVRVRSFKRFVLFTTTLPGFLCYAVDKSSFLFIYDEIFKKEIYKFKTDTDTPFIIDCGANIGLLIPYVLKQYPQAEIIAFEPDPVIFEVLKKNVAGAGGQTNTTCLQACLAKETGEVTFYPDGADGGTMSYSDSETTSITVPAVRLDEYITKKVDLLKIDIEGAEYEVLESIASKLHFVERIFVEYHSFANQTQHFDEILSQLKAAGFRYYIEHIGIRSEEPYIQRHVDHGMDMQINIYGYRQ